MSHQCRSCGRDLNNNYTPYTSGYPNANATNHDRQQQQQQQQQISSYNTRSSAMTTSTTSSAIGLTSSNNQNDKTQVTAKVMFGTVGAIKELRDNEKTRNGTSARAGRRN